MLTVDHKNRLLTWEGCYNVRDLGGLPTEDGRETRWGAVVRSDSPTALTDAGQHALIDHGIRTIVDLRFAKEAAIVPHPCGEPGEHGIVYRRIPIIPDNGEREPRMETIAEGYIAIMDRFQREIGVAVTAIARASEGGVLVHCAGGQDRTGIIAALLLSLAGVPAEVIAEDYALTMQLRTPIMENHLNGDDPEWRAEAARWFELYESGPEIMRRVLAHLEVDHGGAEEYLGGAGVSEEDISSLRRRLLAP